MLIKSVAVSQVGKVREHNEDTVYVDNERGLWIVADGMGGHACGEVASQLAIEVVSNSVSEGAKLINTVSSAHQAILDQTKAQPEQKGMGTTLVAATGVNGGFNLAWVGDSRAYLFNEENNLKQITIDHSFVQDMVERKVLTAEEAIGHPQSNLISRSLGMLGRGFGVDEVNVYPKSSGLLFLCSDGVTDYLPYEQLQPLFKKPKPLQDIADSICNSILETEAADNFSFILISFEINGLAKWHNKLRRNN